MKLEPVLCLAFGLSHLSFSAAKNNNVSLWHMKGLHNLRKALVRIQLNVYPNIPNNSGYTALFWASCKGHPEIVRELLAAHANPDFF